MEPVAGRAVESPHHAAHDSQRPDAVARLELQRDAVVPEHAHVNEQICTVERGALEFSIDGHRQVVRAGESLVIPPSVPHAVVALEDSLAVDIFTPRREDWISGDDAYLRK